MKKQFVTYEIALKLKELGFDKKCLAWFAENKEIQIAPDVYKKWTSKPLTNLNIIKVFNIDCITAPLYQQVIDWCDSKGLLVGTIVVDNLYKSTINKINYETKLFHSRNESIKRAIEFAISYLQDNK